MKDKKPLIIDNIKKDIYVDETKFQEKDRNLILGEKTEQYNKIKYINLYDMCRKKKNSLEATYLYYLHEIKKVDLDKEYIDKCSSFLEERYSEQSKKIEKLCDFYYKKIPKTEREEKYGDLAITKAPEIQERFEKLKTEKVTNSNEKFLKVTGKRLYCLLDEISTNIELPINENYIHSELVHMNLHKSSYICLYKITKLAKALEALAKVINGKYRKIMNDKYINYKVLYFSELECLDMKEIYTLIQEYGNIQEKLKEEIEKIIEDKEYLVNELHITGEDETEIYDDFYYSILQLIIQDVDDLISGIEFVILENKNENNIKLTVKQEMQTIKVIDEIRLTTTSTCEELIKLATTIFQNLKLPSEENEQLINLIMDINRLHFNLMQEIEELSSWIDVEIATGHAADELEDALYLILGNCRVKINIQEDILKKDINHFKQYLNMTEVYVKKVEIILDKAKDDIITTISKNLVY